MEFLITTVESTQFANKDLQKATSKVLKLGEGIRKNWFAIAHIVADVNNSECYKEDGFNNVHEWTEKTFGIKKSASYSLLKIGDEYTREIVNASGKVVGYGTNLVDDVNEDFSKTQVEKMLPVGHEKAVELVENGEITPGMTAKQIEKVIKEKTKKEEPEQETEESEQEAEEPEQEQETEEPEQETEEHLIVVDEYGNKYNVPLSVLTMYQI